MNKLGIIAVLLAGLGFACEHEPVACNLPEEVSFQREIIPLLEQQCSLSGCHSGPYPSGNLNLESAMAYAQLTQPGKGYVDTLNPKFSVVYASMNSSSDPMPPTGKLDHCSIELMYRWMEQKAKNN